jgi:hypothetical protein
MADIATQIQRWTRGTNRRRLAEELLRALGWALIVGVVAFGIWGVPHVLTAFGIDVPSWLPGGRALGIAAAILGGGGFLAAAVRALVRYRRIRTDDLGIARRLDRRGGSGDLLATALAVERGTVSGSPELQVVVHGKATAAIGRVDRPVETFRAPGRVLLGAGSLTALAIGVTLLLPHIDDLGWSLASASEDDTDTDAEAEEEVPPLSEATSEALKKAVEKLERYEQNPGLRRSAKEQLATAREHLQRAMTDPKHALSSLSRAEQALRELAKEARKQGLFDQEQLQQMSQEEVTKQMSEAMKRGEHDTAAAMADELARRMDEASESELREMAEAFKENFEPAPGDSGSKSSSESGESGESGESAAERQERWNKQLEEMAESMRKGESGSSSSEMREMGKELGRESGRSPGSMERGLDDMRSEIEKARGDRLSEMNGEGEGEGKGESGKGKGEGKGEGEGEGGEGEGEGPPSGKPGPGGGEGTHNYPPLGFDNPGSIPGEKIDTPNAGAQKGAIRIIQRASQGGPSGQQYEDLHHEYSDVAEAAVRREEIPLTRRDYIKNYFEAVRPQ